MRKFRLFGILRHAVVMVGRTIKSYAMLSVTIVLSFSLLLGYLLFTDASLYNQYKELFAMRRGDVVIQDVQQNAEKMELLRANLDKLEGTSHYLCYYINFGHSDQYFDGEAIGMEPGEQFCFRNQWALAFPDHAWVDGMDLRFSNFATTGDIVWLENREDFWLAADEVVLGEKVYRLLGFDKEEDPVFTLRSVYGPTVVLRVVGYAESPGPIDYTYSEEGYTVTPAMFLSTKFIDAMEIRNTSLWEPPGNMGTLIYSQYIVVHSEHPEQVTALAEQMGYRDCVSVYEQQNDALEHIRNEKGNKAIIACALLLLLGINLYSSFTNALNDRKFEIGVKRAIGASAGSIVRQFLYESIIVMVANTVISIAVVADVFIIYKYFYERIPDLYGNFNTWTIYISPHSIAMFGLCAVTLTVVFSLIFAYKSTRVEIVQYLKAE